MNLQQLIENFKSFKILSIESPQCIRYAIDLTNAESKLVSKITKIVSDFPTVGSNAYLGNHYDFMEPKKIYKTFRLQLCDHLSLEDDDIKIRVLKIHENLNKKDETNKS